MLGGACIFLLAHITWVGILAFATFMLLKRLRLYPAEKAGTILDTDWFYRRAGVEAVRWIDAVWTKAASVGAQAASWAARLAQDQLVAGFSPRGALSRSGRAGGMAVWTAVLLAGVLLVAFLTG